MRRSLRLAEIEEPTINLTPLIDVVFVILIMFIIVAPLLELDRVELASASIKSEEISQASFESAPCMIHVKKDNSLWFNKRPVSLTQLRLLLQEAHRQLGPITPLLFHDKEAHFGTYQVVKNSCEEAGFKELHVLLAPS